MDEKLELVRRQYFQLLPLHQITLPSNEQLKDAQFQAQLYHGLFALDLDESAPPVRYKVRVLKEVVRRIESSISDPDEDEISDDLVACLTNVLSSSLPSELISAQQKYHVHYTLPLPLSVLEAPKITLLESHNIISASGTTGFRTWDAALRLGTFLVSPQGQNLVREKYVLELGAGTGLLSILCAKHLGSRHVLATDGDAHIVEDLGTNLFLNGLDQSCGIESRVFRWGSTLKDDGEWGSDKSEDETVVLGADITYDKEAFPSLLATMRELFQRLPGVKILLSATIRNETTFNAFLQGCGRSLFQVEDLSIAACALENQTGFFHSIQVPIRILHISGPSKVDDPFAS